MLVVKNLPSRARDLRDAGLIPGWGRSPREGNGNPLQYSCLENPMDRRACLATVHGVTKNQTRLKQLSTYWCKLTDINFFYKFIGLIILVSHKTCKIKPLTFLADFFFFLTQIPRQWQNFLPFPWLNVCVSSSSFQRMEPLMVLPRRVLISTFLVKYAQRFLSSCDIYWVLNSSL